MNKKLENIPAVLPPALDTEETELAARNEFLNGNTNSAEDFASAEIREDDLEAEFLAEREESQTVDEETEKTNARRAKLRKSLIFMTIFGVSFGIFVLFISWVFGFGFFAAPSRVKVDRNPKSNGNSSAPETSSDEKLKTALAIVADETGNKQNSSAISDNSTNPNGGVEENLSLSPNTQADQKSNDGSSRNMIVLPNETEHVQPNSSQTQTRPSQIVSPTMTTQNSSQTDLQQTNQELQPRVERTENNNAKRPVKSDGAVARSIFFGRVATQTDSGLVNSNQIETNLSPRKFLIEPESINLPQFGTLLPVRFLGAVFTLQSSGGLVRMELSRTIQGKNFSYPAGTVLVGRLRGSEANRAFISVVGAIDAKTGKLVKFTGDVIGTDGASGVVGQRKSIKSWGTRFLSALREVGGQTVNILSSRGGRGGTFVLGGTNGIGGEVSSIIRGNANNDIFVVVKAGTEGYVLITDLPGEQREDVLKEGVSENKNSGLNLSETEIAELLTTPDANKIRAALLMMSPKERALAIKAMEENR